MYKQPSKWQVVPLDAVVDYILDYRGKTPKKSISGIPTLSAKSVKNNYIDYSEVYYISNEEYDVFMRKGFPKSGDVLLTTEAPLGLSTILDRDDVGLGQRIVTINGKENVLDNRYLKFYFQSPYGQHELQSRATGTTVTGISQKNLRKINVILPSYEEQKMIANILSSLDEKIENNNAIIANLEEQAQALFKLKFINIEPSEESKFEKVKLGKLFTFVKGKKPKKIIESVKEGFIPYLVKKYIDSNELTYAKANDGILIDDLDVFMLMDGANSGNIYYGYHGILGSTFSWLKNDNEMINEYLYWYLKINQEEVKKQNTGSAIPHANKDYINNMEVLVPIDINENLTLSTLRSIRLYTINLRRESNKHAEIRDTLLPKLMSGEIRVGDVVIEE